jgi:4-amino-4-deoxy-L-arabinose transferase-like glycosyltransferase
MKDWYKGRGAYILIAVFGALLFIPFIGHAPLFDWDEINFAESAREMLLTHNFSQVQINFHPFWEKPPLFIWLQAFSMSIFGVNEFAARLPNALVGVATLLLLFYFGKRYFNERFGFWWVLVYAGSILPFTYFKSGIIDPIFNLFIFLGVMQLVAIANGETGSRCYALSGLFIGLAVLTKGPVGLLVPMLVFAVWVVWRQRFAPFTVKGLLIIGLTTFLVSTLWYGVETLRHGPWFLQQFIAYQIRLLTTGDSGHGGPIYYHVVVLLLGCFPASFLLFKAFGKSADISIEQASLKRWMALLFWVVLVLFSLVKTKIIHYSSLTYFPLTFLATLVIYQIDKQHLKLSKKLLVAWLFYGTLVALAFMVLPLAFNQPEKLSALIKDANVQAYLSVKPIWPTWLIVPGAFYLLVMVGMVLLAIRGKTQWSLITMFVGTALFANMALAMFAGRIGEVSQGPPVNFFKGLAGKDCYVQVLGYKSYAPYFYANKPLAAVQSASLQQYLKEHLNGAELDGMKFMELERDWHLEGKIDKPVYFSCREADVQGFEPYHKLQRIGQKGGFVFLVRYP